MNPSGPARMTVWLAAIFVGAFGWWMLSGVATGLFGWPRASYGQALGTQFGLQIVFHAVAISIGALVSEKD